MPEEGTISIYSRTWLSRRCISRLQKRNLGDTSLTAITTNYQHHCRMDVLFDSVGMVNRWQWLYYVVLSAFASFAFLSVSPQLAFELLLALPVSTVQPSMRFWWFKKLYPESLVPILRLTFCHPCNLKSSQDQNLTKCSSPIVRACWPGGAPPPGPPPPPWAAANIADTGSCWPPPPPAAPWKNITCFTFKCTSSISWEAMCQLDRVHCHSMAKHNSQIQSSSLLTRCFHPMYPCNRIMPTLYIEELWPKA